MRFTVRVAGPAVRVLSRLDAPTQARIRSKLHELQDDPLSAAHSEPLQIGTTSSITDIVRVMLAVGRPAAANVCPCWHPPTGDAQRGQR